MADRIIILAAGEVAAQGTADELSRSLGNRTAITFTHPEGVALDRLSGVLGTPVELEGPLVRFESDRVQRDLSVLLDWAEGERLELVDLQVIRPTLDDVFVQLAGAPTANEGEGSES